MADAFDPAGFYEFDLGQGNVRVRDGSRVLVVHDSVLGPLVAAAVRVGDLEALRALGRNLGATVSRSVPSVEDASPEAVLAQAAGAVALFGWGKLSLERWGDALIATLAHQPKLDPDDLGPAAVLGGLFSALAGRDVACVPLGEHAKYAVADPSVAEQLWTWAREGNDLPTIVGRLIPGEGA